MRALWLRHNDPGRLALRKAARADKVIQQPHLVESLGAEEYAYFEVEGTHVDSEEAADSGATDLPTSAESRIVARLDSESHVRRGQEVDLWVDTTKLHFFHPEGGRNLAE